MIKLQVIGNLGNNAKVTEVNGNKSINFQVAYNRQYVNADGVVTESTTWVNCSYWRRGQQTTEVAKYLTSGTKVFVEGTPSVDTYTNKENKVVASMNLNVTNVELLSGKKEGSSPDAEKQPAEKAEKPL